MSSNWFKKKLDSLSSLKGYQKPEIHQGYVKLDSNENFAISTNFQNEIIEKARKITDVREYPLGRMEKLYENLSSYLKIPSNMIAVGNGSDQILDLFLSNFATKSTTVLTSKPTFSFFEERCKLYNLKMIQIPFSSKMTLDPDEFIKNSKKSDILYLDSPNNPTGFQFSKKNILKIIDQFQGLIIIDEAYGEFSDYSLAKITKKYDNLLVVKTFSKVFGLAGLRLGYFIATKKIIDTFRRVIQYPYPLNSLSIEAGILAIQKSNSINGVVETVKNERQRVIQNLRKFNAFEVFDSKGNFVMFDARGADKRVYTALKEQGISIRKLGKVATHKGCLRVSIGSREMNSKFLLAIRDLLR